MNSDKQNPPSDDLIEEYATGKRSMLDDLMTMYADIHERKDYKAFIKLSNDYVLMSKLVLERNPEYRNIRNAEVRKKYKESTGEILDQDAINSTLELKGGGDRFRRFINTAMEALDDGPPLIAGETFKECLGQYHALRGYVEELWEKARYEYHCANFPLATFFSILAIEEIGKLWRLNIDLMTWDNPRVTGNPELGSHGRNHRKKQFVGVTSGALINARLDRLLGTENVKAILHDVENGKIEVLRQECLYIDIIDGRARLPREVISEATAKTYVILAGELWMEVLGHFSWEYNEMFKKVEIAERKLGVPDDLLWPK